MFAQCENILVSVLVKTLICHARGGISELL